MLSLFLSKRKWRTHTHTQSREVRSGIIVTRKEVGAPPPEWGWRRRRAATVCSTTPSRACVRAVRVSHSVNTYTHSSKQQWPWALCYLPLDYDTSVAAVSLCSADHRESIVYEIVDSLVYIDTFCLWTISWSRPTYIFYLFTHTPFQVRWT